MSSPVPILQLRDIAKSFPGVRALQGVSLDIYPGEVHCLVGENGAGKSTLIKILSGAYRPDAGAITYQGQAVHHLTPRWAREHGILTIYQEVDLVPDLSVAENIVLGNEPLGWAGQLDWAAIHRQARRILDDIGLQLDIRAPVGALSVAHQQMAAIAKALSLNGKVLILDEPTAVFTGAEIEVLFGLIGRLKAQGIALVYISHHLNEIFEIGDRITVLRDGRLIRTGTVNEFDKQSLVQAMVGRQIETIERAGATAPGEELLRAEGITRNGVIDEISLTLRRGEIVGVAGLVGAGRTEMARALIGADPLDRGQIYFRGRKVRISSPRRALRLGIGMVPESRKEEGLVLVRPVAENAAYSAVESDARAGIVPWPRIRARVRRLIADLEVRPADPNVQVQFLSGGNQQKVVLARWLAARCDLLILDEPTRGVDVGARAEIYRLMHRLKAEGKAILMISSDMTEILTQSDRVLVMARGRIAGELSHAEATEQKVLALALQLGGEAG